MSDDNTEPSNAGGNIAALRTHLFETLRAVRAGTLELDKARVINEIGKTLVDTGRLEVDHIRATEGAMKGSTFIEPALADTDKALPNGITGIVRHRIAR